MSNIYTAIDIGSDTVKLVTVKKHNGKFYPLASDSIKSHGVKKGLIVNAAKVVEAIKEVKKRQEAKLNTEINKVIACVYEDETKFDMAEGEIEFEEEKVITGSDISEVIKEAASKKILNKEELVTVTPVFFRINDLEKIKNPKGKRGTKLEVKVVLTTSPKTSLYQMLGVIDLAGLEVVDMAYKTIGDYYTVHNKDIDQEVGAIINIGEDITTISIFNKGIMINTSSIPLGGHHVNNDLAYVYKIDRTTANRLKEEFATASENYSDDMDKVEIVDNSNEKQEVSQLDISKVVEARIVEILKVAKKEIKNLTKREIRYIIITGGMTELSGFSYVVDDVFRHKATVFNMTTLGARENKYSAALGIIKYYDEKLALRDQEETLIDDNFVKTNINEDKNAGVINKMFGHFFD